jgi:D-3-phosphoglycerate dehydrogenase / 2-oxoglutarate reductase
MGLWIDPVFDLRLAQEPGVVLRVAPARDDDEAAWHCLAQAHVYQISAARNELLAQFHAGEALLARCPNLLCVSSTGAGHDTVDVEACTRAGVLVVNQVGGNARSVGEMALGLMLALSRRIAESDRRLRSERGFVRESLMGHELDGRTLGIVGIGHTGRCTAALARAFGMAVLAHDPLLDDEVVRSRGAEPVELPELLRRADVVSLHCPLDAGTTRLFDAQRFASMKRGALFVSTARGGIHDETALLAALTSGHLGGAALDVWQTEPPPLDHPLLTLPNVVATWHTAGVSHEGRHRIAAMAADQVLCLLRGERPPRMVNPEIWPTVARRLADRAVASPGIRPGADRFA